MRWFEKPCFETLSDAEVVERVRAGATNDYAELVRRHQDVLFRHARGMGLDYDTALDLVQDAFVKAFALLSECREPARFRAWAFRITRNLCLDHLKNVRRLSIPMSDVPEVENLPGDARDFELGSTLHAALATLPESLREAFLLKHLADYTYDEIAQLTNASPSAVKMRVHRARETLRAFLIENDVHAA
jgi:RNA polymerase sigma factor (sigma-70 family)